MKIFYCAKCNKIEIDFKFSSRKEETVRETWLNIRDGYGRPIHHLICPHCGYVLSGYMNWNGEVDDGIFMYIQDTIKMYSTKEYEGKFLKEGTINYIYDCEVKKKKEKYRDVEDIEIQTIINSMSNIDD